MNRIPSWDDFSECLRKYRNYSESTLLRTSSTYRSFINHYVPTEKGGDAASDIENGVRAVYKAFEDGAISNGQFHRLRKISSMILMVVKDGTISWQRTAPYGKRFGDQKDEELIIQWMEAFKEKLSASILRTYKNILRQYALFCLDNKSKVINKMSNEDIYDFLVYMHQRRPAGIKNVVAALKSFYSYLITIGEASSSVLLALKTIHETAHKKVYRVFTADEEERLLATIERNTCIGSRDYAIFSLAIDCGIRSHDICSLKLENIDWHNSRIIIVQKKTGIPLSLPFSIRTGNALSDYILNYRGDTVLRNVFLKVSSYTDSEMTSSGLCVQLKRYLKTAGIPKSADERIGIHTFRRSLGTDLINSGQPLECVSQILGHTGTESTQHYLSLSEERLRLCPLNLEFMDEEGGDPDA